MSLEQQHESDFTAKLITVVSVLTAAAIIDPRRT